MSMTPDIHRAAEEEVAAAMKLGEERGTGFGRELLMAYAKSDRPLELTCSIHSGLPGVFYLASPCSAEPNLHGTHENRVGWSDGG